VFLFCSVRNRSAGSRPLAFRKSCSTHDFHLHVEAA
jgi:hypothetical protein